MLHPFERMPKFTPMIEASRTNDPPSLVCPPLPSFLSPGFAAIVPGLLLLLGVQLWLTIGHSQYGNDVVHNLLFFGAAPFLIPWLARRLVALLDKLRHPTPRGRLITGCIITLTAIVYLTFSAFYNRRYLGPMWADDFAYLLQMRMLAEGHPWMPQHELADFFESLQILVEPKYASIYFPGAALLYAPTFWIGLPIWVLPMVVMGVVIGLTYRVIAELIDGAAGIIAVIWMLGLSWARITSTMVTSTVPLMLFGLIMIWAWMRWRREHSLRWALVIGTAAGWAAITRPLDALCFAVPIGIAMLISIRAIGLRRFARSAACVVAGAVPFLSLQFVINHGVTGSPRHTPFSLYADRDYPGTSFGFHPPAAELRPASELPQKHALYKAWVAPRVAEHRPEMIWQNWIVGSEQRSGRLPLMAEVTLPQHFVLILLPVGVLGLTCARRCVLVSVIPLFIGGYVFYAFFQDYYSLILAPAFAALAMLGVRAMSAAWSFIARPLEGFCTAAIIMLACSQTMELNRHAVQDNISAEMDRRLNTQLAQQLGPDERAVVLIANGQEAPVGVPFVHNIETSWPDDARTIRANHLGSRNRELITFYGKHQPDRVLFMYDKRDARFRDDQPGIPLQRIGRVGDVYEAMQQELGAQRP